MSTLWFADQFHVLKRPYSDTRNRLILIHIFWSTYEKIAAKGKTQGLDRRAMPGQGLADLLAGFGVPNYDCGVLATGCQKCPLRIKSYYYYWISMMKLMNLLFRFNIPDTNGFIPGSGRDIKIWKKIVILIWEFHFIKY